MVGLNILSYLPFQKPNEACISMLQTIIAKTGSVPSKYSIDNFHHPQLTHNEHSFGCKLGIDSWADTCCAGKHAFVEEFVEGKIVNATGFTPSLGALNGLPIAHVVYAHDTLDGSVLLLECNNSIYLGDNMADGLINPIQCEENGVRVDTRPKVYYLSSVSAQTLVLKMVLQLESCMMEFCPTFQLDGQQRRKFKVLLVSLSPLVIFGILPSSMVHSLSYPLMKLLVIICIMNQFWRNVIQSHPS